MTLTAQQQEVRSKGVGASEVGALVGLDPYRTKLDLYMKKLGLTEDVQTFHTRRGQYLEPALRTWASDVIGLPFAPGLTRAHPDHPHVLATADGEAPDADHEVVAAVLELKAPGPRTFHEWGDGDNAPDRYIVQVTQQMAVAGAEVGYLAAFLGDDLRVYRFERDRELEGELVDAIERFWRDHIEPQVPPEVDGRDGGRAWLAKRFPEAVRPELIRADGATETLLARYREVRELQAKADAERELLEQRLKATIGDAAGLESPLGKVTWKGVRGRTSLDWEAYARALGGTDDGAKQHTKQGASYRRFLFTPSK